MRKCKDCEFYTDETYTSTGVGIAYCYEKESKRYGLPTGSLKTVVYEDGSCKCWKGKHEEQRTNSDNH